MKRSLILSSLLVVIAICAIACATAPIKSPSQMSTDELVYTALKTYNMTYDNTMAMAKRTNLTEAQKQIVRQKKDLLIRIQPYIDKAKKYSEGTGTVLPADRQELINFLDDLTALGG